MVSLSRHRTIRAEEKKRRTKEVQTAQARARATAEALEAARQNEARLRQDLAAADRLCQELREEYRECLGQVKQARGDVERLQGDCATLYDDLPESFRKKVGPAPVSDWLALW